MESQIQSPLRKLVITHHHADHTLGIPVFKDCEIIASEPYKKLKRTSKYQPTRTFEDTLILEDQDLQVEIVHAGGHSQDSSYVYFPKEKILFSGDIIFAKTFFYAGDRTFNPEKWRDVLRRLVERDIKRIIPGHGPLCSEEEAKRYLKFFEATSSIMKDLVQKGFNEREAVRYSEFPAFYPEYRKGVKELALSNWYRFYKRGKRRGS